MSTLEEEFLSYIRPLSGESQFSRYAQVRNAMKFNVCKPEYGFIRGEIMMCLICKFDTAAITLTNHYLEKFLKYVLINHHTKLKHIDDLKESNDLFKEAIKKYGGADMGKNIQSLFDLGLIDEDGLKGLRHLKNTFRNPFSHSDFRGIFKDEQITLHRFSFTNPDLKESATVNIADALITHGISLNQLAEQNAIPYFLAVDKIVCKYEILRYPELLKYNQGVLYPPGDD